MTKRESGWIAAGVLVALIAMAVGMACTPGNEITASESDVAITNYDKTYDFGAVKTWAMPDSVIQITDPDDPKEISRQFDAQILAEIEDRMTDRGYQRITDLNQVTPADVVVLVTMTTADTYYLYSYYPWYGWWGGWGWYYPGYYPPYYGASYAYSTGTIIISMAEPDDIDPETETIRSVWTGALNGVANDNSTSVSNRITRGINQIFAQSPYLKSRG